MTSAPTAAIPPRAQRVGSEERRGPHDTDLAAMTFVPAEPLSRRKTFEGWHRLQETAGLWSLAVAQPLFDIAARHGEFLVVHKLDFIDLGLIALVLALACPAVVVGVEWLLAAGAPIVGRSFHVAGLGVLVALLSLQLLRRTGLSSAPCLLLALLSGALLVGVRWRSQAVKQGLRFLALGVVVFPLLFFLSPDVSAIFRASLSSSLRSLARPSVAPLGGRVESKTPVVVVVFDELPLASLLDHQGEIESLLYPNFANLAERATWYRRATAVSESTTLSVPSILTGKYPLDRKPPTLDGYPDNLFTWLEGSYRLSVFEPATNLCPPAVCRAPASLRESRFERLVATFADLWVVYLHLNAPRDWAARLPSLSGGWRGFEGGGPLHGRERRYWGDVTSVVEQLLKGLERSDPPTLHFAHINLPHLPWKYLPSGREYGPLNSDLFPYGVDRERWIADERATLQGLQRHLLQLAYTDRVLGKIVSRMEDTGLYEEALLVVTADHGAAFWPEAPRRGIAPETLWEILRVPLLIKFPHQVEGRTVDTAAELVDVLSTIADVLNGELGWETDGRSLRHGGEVAPRLHTYTIVGKDRRLVQHQVVFEAAGLEAAVARRWRWFPPSPEGSPEAGLFRLGPRPDLLGRATASLAVRTTDPPSIVAIEDETSLAEVDATGQYLPARIIGTLEPPAGRPAGDEIAIAINGVVAATTWSQVEASRSPGDSRRFMAMVPETVFRAGSNRVEVFEIASGDQAIGDKEELIATAMVGAVTYRLVLGGGGHPVAIEASDGRRFDVRRGAVQGSALFDSTQFRGWAADVVHRRPAAAVLVFRHGEFLTETSVGLDRPDIRRLEPPVGGAGFALVVPYGAIGTPGDGLAFYALLDGSASRIPYREAFKG